MPVSDGHFAAVYCRFENKPSKEEILTAWKEFSGEPLEAGAAQRPQAVPALFRRGQHALRPSCIAVWRAAWPSHWDVCGEDTQYDYKFVGLSHNTLRGAAGGAVLLAELLCAKGYMD